MSGPSAATVDSAALTLFLQPLLDRLTPMASVDAVAETEEQQHPNKKNITITSSRRFAIDQCTSVCIGIMVLLTATIYLLSRSEHLLQTILGTLQPDRPFDSTTTTPLPPLMPSTPTTTTNLSSGTTTTTTTTTTEGGVVITP